MSIISKGTCADNLHRNEESEGVHYICTEDKQDQCQVNYIKNMLEFLIFLVRQKFLAKSNILPKTHFIPIYSLK